MKRIILLFFAVATAFSAYSQNYLQDGDRCFDKGDYACAEKKYNEAFKSTSGKNKQIADLKLNRAKNCSTWLKTANQAFANKNYTLAKENYQKVLESNPKDLYAIEQREKCNNALNLPTTLSVSKESLTFTSSGGNETITITCNASSYSINGLPSWCAVQKYTEHFVVTCSANSATTTRTDYFTVAAGNKTKRINVSQDGKTITTASKQETTLSVSMKNISFIASSGKILIDVKTNANDYKITYLPSWCRVGKKHSTWFSLVYDSNTSKHARSDWFKITAGDKEVKIYVTQSGVSNTTVQSKKKCFNCPKTKDTWGLTLGYINQNPNGLHYSLEGVQLGLRIEPLFKYGFGLNTGIILEGYHPNLLDEQLFETGFDIYAINIPLHLEYRLNFSKWFNIFAYGGVGMDIVTNSSFDDYFLPIAFEYGCGLRINHIQFNIGQSLYLKNLKSTDNFYYIGNANKYKNIVLSISYMF
jgi:hypothetical protein